MSELIKTAPKKIYLCVSDDVSSKNEPFPDYQGEVTWRLEPGQKVLQ